MKKTLLLISSFIFIAIVILNGTNQLEAKRNGKTGATNNNSKSCGDCHSANPNSNVTVTLTSEKGSFEVEPESKTKFTLTISTPSGNSAGCNIAVKTQLNGNSLAGTLEAINGSGLALSQKELTHTQPKAISSGKASFDFFWIAPKEPGDYYLQAVALAANGNNSPDNGDIWNFAQTQVIKVKSPNSVEYDNFSKPISIYPNPFNSNSNIIINNIEIYQKIENIIVLNHNGQIVSNFGNDLEVLKNAVNKLSTGVFFLQFLIDGKTFTEKIIKID